MRKTLLADCMKMLSTCYKQLQDAAVKIKGQTVNGLSQLKSGFSLGDTLVAIAVIGALAVILYRYTGQ